MEKIEELAKECLNCKNPMCRAGCPVLTNIPKFIQLAKSGNMEEAYINLQKNNIMSEICSKICPVEEQCVGHCIKGIKGTPVRINKLEELVNIWGKEHNIENKTQDNSLNNKKVAVIGGGPSGIACAVQLKTSGYDVTIFEKKEKLGGILEYEIPDFRLSKEYVKEISDKVNEMGVKTEFGKEFGKDINLESLRNKGYKAVFLGIGAYIPNIYDLSPSKSVNIYTANTILNMYYNKDRINNLGSVVVIGGGNVAMDVARTLKRAGNSSVTIAYRRTKELMPAIEDEQEDAKKDGVDFLYNTRVIEAIESNNKIERIKCIKTKIENNKAIDIPESEFELMANAIVFAIGQGIDKKMLNDLEIEMENGLVKVDEFGMTNKKGIFAGGDLIEKNQTVCRAIASGKKAAIGINKYLENKEGHC